MRVLLRVLAPLLGLAVAAAGALLVIEVATAWARPGSGGLLVPWARWRVPLAADTWSDRQVLVVAVCAAVVGLLLMVVAALAGRRDVALVAPDPAMTITTSPRVLARLVGRHVRAADDVAGAAVIASARKVSVTATGWPPAGGAPREAANASLRENVRSRVDELLDALPLAHRPRVAVSTRPEPTPR